MTKTLCPTPGCTNASVIRKGFFRISYNNQKVRRYFCKSCEKGFSFRTNTSTYKQLKPYLNKPIRSLLSSGMTMRGVARHLRVSKTTVSRKFLLVSQEPPATLAPEELQFDELETIHHTKCKPLSILVCVSGNGGLIALKVAEMPAKGRLAEFSVKKYGKRKDDRAQVLEKTLLEISKSGPHPKLIKTDAHPSYKKYVQSLFPMSEHQVFNRSQKEKLQSRLHEKNQKTKFDPLFQVNHLCARLRADIRRLTRRSWCTTKRPDYLQRHLDLYSNERLGIPV